MLAICEMNSVSFRGIDDGNEQFRGIEKSEDVNERIKDLEEEVDELKEQISKDVEFIKSCYTGKEK